MEVKHDIQAIQKRGNLKYLGSIIPKKRGLMRMSLTILDHLCRVHHIYLYLYYLKSTNSLILMLNY